MSGFLTSAVPLILALQSTEIVLGTEACSLTTPQETLIKTAASLNGTCSYDNVTIGSVLRLKTDDGGNADCSPSFSSGSCDWKTSCSTGTPFWNTPSQGTSCLWIFSPGPDPASAARGRFLNSTFRTAYAVNVSVFDGPSDSHPRIGFFEGSQHPGVDDGYLTAQGTQKKMTVRLDADPDGSTYGLSFRFELKTDEALGAAMPGECGWNRSSSFKDGVPMPDYAPAYLAGGLFGVRIPPNALARPGSCANCTRSNWNFNQPTVSCLVGGYVHREDAAGSQSANEDGQYNLQIGASPAPYPFETDVRVVTPGGKRASFQASAQGPDMNADPSEVTPLSQWLSFETGELTTTMTFGAKDGSWSVDLRAVQLISQSVPSLAVQTLTVTARKPASLSVTMLPSITTFGLPGQAMPYSRSGPAEYVASKKKPGNIFGGGVPNMLVSLQSNSGSQMAMNVATLCSNHPVRKPLKEMALPCNSTTGVSTMTSFIGVVSDASHPVPAAGAIRSAHFGLYRNGKGSAQGSHTNDAAGKLQAENRKVWRSRWKLRIVPQGPGVRPQDQTAIDAAMFYLLSSAHTASRSGLAIDAYSCLEYGGRMFWDADLWMVPALALLNAPASAAVTGFRGRTLDMAKRNAGLYGLDGAMYPWETATSDGHDACVAGGDWSEQHITLDVGLGVLATARAYNDVDFNLNTAFPVLSNVAKWLLSRGEWTERGFEVLHMGGPDESLGQVNNSNFFNIAGMMVLEGAIEVAETLPQGYADKNQVAEWQKALAGMVLEKTNGVIKPFSEAPNDLSKANADNWSLGSLAYLFALRLPTNGAMTEAQINATLRAEEVMRHRFAATGSVPCSSNTEWFICGPYASITAYLGNRSESAQIQASFADDFHLPPFWITTEVAASRRKFGHYGTNWGASLQALMLGLTGVRLGKLGTSPTSWSAQHTATLPQGWSSLSFGAWLGGKRHKVVATHGAHGAITLLD